MTTYVLVHGGFIGGWYWRDTAALLEKDGHRVHVVEQMPSAGRGDPAQLGDLRDDAEHVRQIIDGVGEPVVLVGHSYGGMVVTELADHPAVVHTVYVSAFLPQRGQSIGDLFGGGPPDWGVAHDDGTLTVTDDLDVAHQALCADVDPEQAYAELRRLLPQSMSSFTAPSTAPDRRHRMTYIICEQDNAVPVAAQEQMAADADHVERLPSSHQPMASMPDKLAQVLARVS